MVTSFSRQLINFLYKLRLEIQKIPIDPQVMEMAFFKNPSSFYTQKEAMASLSSLSQKRVESSLQNHSELTKIFNKTSFTSF